MNRETVTYWCNALEESTWGEKPLRSDDERIVRLYESLEAWLSPEKIAEWYQRRLTGKGDRSTEAEGIAFLVDAYQDREYDPKLRQILRARRRGETVSADAKEYELERQMGFPVWRKCEVRKKIVDAVKLLLTADADAKQTRMTAEEIAIQANGILATETKAKRSVPSKNELARRVGCSPNAPALIKAWKDYRKAGGGSFAKPKSQAIDEGIGCEDKELERLIREQEAEAKADLRMHRGKQRARTPVDD
ncbi:hypothetical protein Q31b_19670 [Novipirellula aureliae]|uniref:Uncharacterized protein n=1 Tax=Novipirellula aureliae TaxID=2527966 RepID=A0A5C6E358_9BACT|nr:hypothetical protein [Novipirellula aureliae]TWU42934.1 hypothetical protein Q31b_19670 [Novipirellula aureliae]